VRKRKGRGDDCLIVSARLAPAKAAAFLALCDRRGTSRQEVLEEMIDRELRLAGLAPSDEKGTTQP
jgi:uncharacterized protein GlcG (DUF336 family)